KRASRQAERVVDGVVVGEAPDTSQRVTLSSKPQRPLPRRPDSLQSFPGSVPVGSRWRLAHIPAAPPVTLLGAAGQPLPSHSIPLPATPGPFVLGAVIDGDADVVVLDPTVSGSHARLEEWQGGDAALAERLCREALTIEADNKYLLTLLGSILVTARKFEEARRVFHTALEATQWTHVPTLLGLARLESGALKMDLARDLFKRALDLQPDSVPLLQAWAVAESRYGSVAEARALFQQCMGIEPQSVEALHAWAKMEAGEGDLNAARRLYAQGLAAAPTNCNVLADLALLEIKEGDLAAAQNLLDTAMQAGPRHPRTLAVCARLRAAQGSRREAAALSMQAQQLGRARRGQLNAIRHRNWPDAGRGRGGEREEG
ncbi:hypothetical protein APUTEX25_004940, partial [Auxenochlorella protothecoides]